MPLSEIVESILTQASDVLGGPRESRAILAEPLFDHYGDQRVGKTEYKGREPETVERHRRRGDRRSGNIGGSASERGLGRVHKRLIHGEAGQLQRYLLQYRSGLVWSVGLQERVSLSNKRRDDR